MRAACWPEATTTNRVTKTGHANQKAFISSSPGLCGGRGRGGTRSVVGGRTPLESPMAVFAHEDVVVASCLRDRGAFLTGDDERPARPGGRGVAVHGNHKVREQVIVLRAIRRGAPALLHER